MSELSQYREIIRKLPRPTDRQIDDFVLYVCDAHSWYKHLPLYPPGTPFVFGIDPYAGFECVNWADGHKAYEERTEDSLKFHYTWMTTDDYQARFGHLTYKCAAGSFPILIRLGGHEGADAQTPPLTAANAGSRAPSEVARAGRVELTGVIHRHAAEIGVWRALSRRWAKREPSRPQNWPIETGGEAMTERMNELFERRTKEIPTVSELSPIEDRDVRLAEVERLQRLQRLQEQYNEEFAALLLPEKQRLQQAMRDAIHRMLAVAYG